MDDIAGTEPLKAVCHAGDCPEALIEGEIVVRGKAGIPVVDLGDASTIGKASGLDAVAKATVEVYKIVGGFPRGGATGTVFKRKGKLLLVTARHALYFEPVRGSSRRPDRALLGGGRFVPLDTLAKTSTYERLSDTDYAVLEVTPSNIPADVVPLDFDNDKWVGGLSDCKGGDTVVLVGRLFEVDSNTPVVAGTNPAAYKKNLQGKLKAARGKAYFRSAGVIQRDGRHSCSCAHGMSGGLLLSLRSKKLVSMHLGHKSNSKMNFSICLRTFLEKVAVAKGAQKRKRKH